MNNEDDKEMQYELVDVQNQNLLDSNYVQEQYYSKAFKLEFEFLQKYSNLKPQQDLEIKNVFISESEWIHTYVYGNTTNQCPLVLAHGYGNCSTGFYKLIQSFGKDRQVIAFDWLGNGLSSRPDFHGQDPSSMVNFFTESMEKWRVQMGIEQFVLVGHSLGGYLSAHYAIKYPQFIKNLHLISPLGSTKVTESQAESYEQDQYQNLCCLNKIVYNKLVKKGWEREETPQSLLNWRCLPTSCIFKLLIKFVLKMGCKEASAFRNLMKEIYNIPGDSAYTIIYKHFTFPRLSAPFQFSLQEILPVGVNHQFQVHFYYGDKDWMDQQGAQILTQSNLVGGSFNIIQNSNHDIQCDNPKQLAQTILEKENQIQEYVEEYSFSINYQQHNEQNQLNSHNQYGI